MSEMQSPTGVASATADDVLAGIDVLRRRWRLDKPVDALTAAGIGEATAYRRLKRPGSMSHDELTQVAAHFAVPVHVLAEGELAVMRWLVNNHDDGGGPGVTLRPRQDSNLRPSD